MKITDQEYLKEDQYKSAGNLQARIALHQRFGTRGPDQYGWQRWVFERLTLQPGMRVLEVGCGPGGLWQENLGLLPRNVQVILVDLSQGMVGQARQILGEAGASDRNFDFLCVDAQAMPFPSSSFDLVIANHMLYHVPDLSRGVKETARLLKSGGRLCAATNGENHMRELKVLLSRFRPGYDDAQWGQARRYCLENAVEILGPVFPQVETQMYDENLAVTEVEPLVAYICSMWGGLGEADSEQLSALRSYVGQVIEEQGSFWITKAQGVVLARK